MLITNTKQKADGQIESHRKLTERVHAAGGKIAAQIYHAGRETSSAVTGVQPVAPSAVREPSMPETPRELTIPEIHTLVEQFGDCAKRAKAAGFDAVEVHGAHGYLAGAFASPFSNKRSDEYGGTIRNRARFGMEIIRNIKEKCGEDYPVLYRISSVEYVPGGLGIEESKVIARLMEEASADCIHCSQGVYASTHTIIPPSVFPRAGYVEHAAEMKKAVQIPVIAVGRINDVEIAESVLQSKKADLVTMARASLADPELPNKVLKGRGDEVIRCISCLQGCIGENGKGNGIRCLVNPLTGMEDEYDLTPAEKAKQVLVIGGGIAGCEAAISAALKGHKVTLIEKNDRLGGQWIPASVPIGKSEFTSFLCWQKSMLEKMHVQILLNTTADAELIKLYEPDTVIIATGSRPFIPPIQGADQDFVVTAHDVLLGKTEPGNRVVVIGGGLVGAETADMLGQQCEQVTIIEMLPQIMKDGEAAPTKYMKERFSQNGVQIHTSTKLLEIGDDTVTAENLIYSAFLPGSAGSTDHRCDRSIDPVAVQWSCRRIQSSVSDGASDRRCSCRRGVAGDRNLWHSLGDGSDCNCQFCAERTGHTADFYSDCCNFTDGSCIWSIFKSKRQAAENRCTVRRNHRTFRNYRTGNLWDHTAEKETVYLWLYLGCNRKCNRCDTGSNTVCVCRTSGTDLRGKFHICGKSGFISSLCHRSSSDDYRNNRKYPAVWVRTKAKGKRRAFYFGTNCFQSADRRTQISKRRQ